MEIKITTNQILKVLQIFSWIIFIGLCVQAGGMLFNTIITLFINPPGVKNFWEGSDYLANLYQFDRGYFIVITSIMIIVGVLKAILFYRIVKLFVHKKLSMSQPFNNELRRFILLSAYLTLGIGLFAHFGFKYSSWLTTQGVKAIDTQLLHIGGADVWLFMAIIFFVIAQIIKRGIEIQTENDLTI